MNALPVLTDNRPRPHVSMADSLGTGTPAVTTHRVVSSCILCNSTDRHRYTG
jgi:hypothetical protein